MSEQAQEQQASRPVRIAESGVELIAYELTPNPGYVLEPAKPVRDWMDKAPGKTPYRCLPMVMANQGGWVIRSPAAFNVSWNGKADTSGLKVSITDPQYKGAPFVVSNFGMGIITLQFPWMFRTPPGVGLWVHGPPNEPRDNLTALEGLVETDWIETPFTMNWKIQRRNSPVYFQRGDAVCMLTPFPMDLLETVEPRFRLLSDNPELMESVLQHRKRRLEMVKNQTVASSQDGKTDWEKTYVKGQRADGSKTEEHRTNFKLRPFEARD